MDAPNDRHAIRFLSEPRAYVCALPASVDRDRPEMGSVVTLVTGERRIGSSRAIHVTYRSDPADDPELISIGDVEQGGVSVSRYRVDDSPPFLVAYWRLGGDRYLTTFMPARDALDARLRGAPDLEGLDAVIGSVVVGSAHGLPLLALTAPLRHGDLRDPEQRDETQFSPPEDAARQWPVVHFRREPPWTLESGAVQVSMPLEDDPDSWAEAWAVTQHQVRVACHGPAAAVDELRELVDQLRGTLSYID